MKRHRNTLYVTTQGAYLGSEGECVVLRVDHEERMRLPLHLLEGIVCFGLVSCSPALMASCAERNVCISFLSEHGRFLARVEGPTSGNVLLRRQQYRVSDDAGKSAAIARTFVQAKLANSRTVLLRSLRDHPDESGSAEVRRAADRIGQHLSAAPRESDLNRVRGIEGEAASDYFAVFDHLLVAKNGFAFSGRSRRPPLDPLNALLSFIYTILTHDARSALESVGLDPQVGFLHRDRPGRPSLALDLIEELRPVFADRLVLSLTNRHQVSVKGFKTGETGGCVMDDDTRKVVLAAYQERKQEEIKHPFLGEQTTVGLLVHLQALLLARFLRGDLDSYPAFVWR